MDVSSLTSGLNPLSLLGGGNPLGGLGGAEGTDPLALLSQLFGSTNAGSASTGDQGSTCSCCGGGETGACNCGCSCCQKNADLGF